LADARLNDGLIGDIISALIRALSAPPAPSKDGDAQDRDEGDALGEPSSDQLARNLDAESEQSEIDWPRLVTACRKRLSQMITRLEARMMEASAGTHTPAWSIGSRFARCTDPPGLRQSWKRMRTRGLLRSVN
jgi:hypothetical protein